jgi:NitT/TauT family transport system substrate-binding protein
MATLAAARLAVAMDRDLRRWEGWKNAGGDRMRAIGRRAVLAGPALLLPAAAPAALQVGKGGQNAFSFTMLDLGIKQGIYARHGLEVSGVEFAGGAKTDQALAAGSIDVGLAGGTDLAAISHGAAVKAVASMGGPPLDFAITVRGDGPVKDLDGLRGRRVAVTTLASLTAWLTQELSRRQGWGDEGITRLAAGSGQTSWALLRTGQVDGIAGDLGSALQAEARGDGRVLVRFGDVIRQFQTFVIYASDGTIAQRPDDLRAFLAGWFETVAFAAANRDRTVATMAGVLGLSPAVTGELWQALMPMFSRDGRFLPDNLQALGRALQQQNGTSISPTMFDTRFLPA